MRNDAIWCHLQETTARSSFDFFGNGLTEMVEVLLHAGLEFRRTLPVADGFAGDADVAGDFDCGHSAFGEKLGGLFFLAVPGPTCGDFHSGIGQGDALLD